MLSDNNALQKLLRNKALIKSLILIFVFNQQLFAQAPEAFNYSAVARDALGNPISNTTIGIQISILKGNTLGNIEYMENHFVNTDQFGLFSLIVGAGAIQSGNISSINWSSDSYYLKVGMDANGGTNFLTMGVTQLLSVPYSLHSATADSVLNGSGSFSGDYNDLTNSPSDVSNFNNDAGYLTFESDSSVTNEIQSISRSGLTITLSHGGGNYQDSINEYTAGPGINISNNVISSSTGSFTHYVGETFGGGLVYHVYKDTQGVEHGFIVSLTDISTGVNWGLSGIDVPNCESFWNGPSNSTAILTAGGSSTESAGLCNTYSIGGYNDWYLPSIQEINLLWNNLYFVNKNLFVISAATELGNYGYWTSTEADANTAFAFSMSNASIGNTNKSLGKRVRAIRAF